MGIFVSAVAQPDNIGDVVIRRELISWVRASGRDLHVLTSMMPAGYVEALDLEPGEACPSQRQWLMRFFRECLRGRADLCFPPGMQPMANDRAAYARALLHLVMAASCRLGGGAVVKVGRSLEGRSRGLLLLERWLRRLCHIYALRDVRSPRLLGVPARTAPDLAVAAESAATVAHQPVTERPAVAVTWRSDTDVPVAVVEAVDELCRREGLELVLVTQVRRDGRHHDDLAARLGCRHLDWPDDISHAEQLRRVANEYARSRAVVSNRLHGLLLGWDEGAVPVGYSAAGDRKIWNHVERLGLGELLVREDTAVADIGVRLASHEISEASRRRCRQELETLRAEILAQLGR